MQQYNKLIVALIGVVVMLLKDHVGIDLSAFEPDLVNTIIGLITAAGVYAVPNKPKPATEEVEPYNVK